MRTDHDTMPAYVSRREELRPLDEALAANSRLASRLGSHPTAHKELFGVLRLAAKQAIGVQPAGIVPPLLWRHAIIWTLRPETDMGFRATPRYVAPKLGGLANIQAGKAIRHVDFPFDNLDGTSIVQSTAPRDPAAGFEAVADTLVLGQPFPWLPQLKMPWFYLRSTGFGLISVHL